MSEAITDRLILDPEPASVGAARRFVRGRLVREAIAGDLVDTAVLLTSELVTNAVIHTDTAIEVRVALSPEVRVEVQDLTARLPQRRSHGEESVTGRGLELVEALASRFGVALSPPGGKTVWFTLGGPSSEASSDWDAGAGQQTAGVRVVLRHLPVLLYEVMREQYEAMLREYSVAALQDPAPEHHLVGDIEEADRSRLLIAEAFSAWKSGLAGGELPSYVDLVVSVPPERASGFVLLRLAVHAADEMATSGRLLTSPPLAEVTWLRDWVLDEVATQLAGGEPTPWRLPEPAHQTPATTSPDVSWVHDSDRAVILADAANRILAVSAAAGELLSWSTAALVSQPLTKLIPPRLREMHLAGFTRHLLTGRTVILDRPVTVPALRGDGGEQPVELTVTKRLDPAGDAQFVALLRAAG